jgi:hypothetical protein
MIEEKWHIHVDDDYDHEDENSYSISLQKGCSGWTTDSGYDGYGLPKDLAIWICDVLNEHGKDCPYKMEYGYWVKK